MTSQELLLAQKGIKNRFLTKEELKTQLYYNGIDIDSPSEYYVYYDKADEYMNPTFLGWIEFSDMKATPEEKAGFQIVCPEKDL